ncbi:MAG TPA: sulfatase [Oscillospiraceae bacterium]|nr:sulfatase [Oscillospiraceae bacterium]HPF56109.1 sulfatase [Clostridiales bacterium]HPK34357.1 sulfatase [Oscillospiraceae bacterium]HPR75136.1 sulfatase [Oscillospiraceae bacterium]
MDKTEKKTQPNLIYVFADQLRYFSCGYAGDQKAHTPNIDKLSKESVSFCNAISGHPVCAPYRASLFTGKYTTSTGMVINEIRMNPNHACIGHVLTDAGYDTAYIGKWHLWANELGHHMDPKNSFTPAGPDRLGFDGFWAAYNFHHEYYNTYYHTDSPEKITMEGYEPDGQTDMAIKILKQHSETGNPFALFLSIGTPHDPWVKSNVPEQYYDMFKDAEFELPPNYKDQNDPYADNWAKLNPDERTELTEWMRVYYAMTANLDWNIGRLVKAIDELGLRDNSILVFTSDHGEMFGAQGRRAKNIFYEEAVRVPFLMRKPGWINDNSTTDVCLNTPDIMPTLLSMMGLPVPSEVEGMDLSHCALGKPGPEPEAAFLQGTGATAAWDDGHEWRAMRSKQYTYAVYHADGKELLFDNKSDPYQMKNLADLPEYKTVLEQFRTLIKNKMENLNDTFESCSWYRDHWTQDRIIMRTATLQSK